MGEIGCYFSRRDTQAYWVLVVETVSGEIPAELIYRLASNLSYKEALIRQLKKRVLFWHLLDFPHIHRFCNVLQIFKP